MRSRIAPLFPLPLAESFPGTKQRAGTNDDGTIDLYGHCAWWCYLQADSILPNGNSGIAISEHNDEPSCQGQVGMGIEGSEAGGESAYVGIDLVAPYFHGVYDAVDIHNRPGSFVRVSVGDGNGNTSGATHLSAGSARSLAATLLRAADHLDGLAPPTDAR